MGLVASELHGLNHDHEGTKTLILRDLRDTNAPKFVFLAKKLGRVGVTFVSALVRVTARHCLVAAMLRCVLPYLRGCGRCLVMPLHVVTADQ
jgi:hypothetical protein